MSPKQPDSKTNRKKQVAEIFAWLLLLGIVFISVASIYRTTLGSAGLWWAAYAYSELLINYSAGFIRRGLIGAILHHCAGGGSALRCTNWLIFTNYCLLVVSFVLLALRRAQVKAWTAVLVLAIPGGVLAMAAAQEFFYRKETFFYSVFAFCGLWLAAVQRAHSPVVRRYLGVSLVGFIMVLGVLLALVHEVFIFLAAPAGMYLLLAASRAGETRAAAPTPRWGILCAHIYASVQVGLFISFVLFFTTDTRKAETIWESLHPADQAWILQEDHTRGGIAYLAMGVKQVTPIFFQVLSGGMAWYYVATLAFLLLYCLMLIAINRGIRSKEASLRDWIGCYVVLLACALPAFALGMDWGRWANAVSLCFLILWLSIDGQNLVDLRSVLPPGRLAARTRLPKQSSLLSTAATVFEQAVQRHRVRAISLMLFFAITFRLPELILDDSTSYIAYFVPLALKQALHLHK